MTTLQRIIDNLTSFVRALRTNDSAQRPRHGGDDLARTISDASQVGGGPGLGGTARSLSHGADEFVASKASNYAKSFDKKN